MKMFSVFREEFGHIKNSPKPKFKIINGKDGKKGLEIDGKLILPVEYDDIRMWNNTVLFKQYGVFRHARIEELLERYAPTSYNNKFRLICFQRMRCKYCKSKLKVTYDDLEMHYNTVDLVTSYWFDCPYCKGRLELSLKKGNRLKNHL